jgi:hypothetical protein
MRLGAPSPSTREQHVQLNAKGVVFPKLFRRLTNCFNTGGTLSGFSAFAPLHTEQVQILDPTDPLFTNVTHVDTIVKATGRTVKFTTAPELLLFTRER